MRNAQVIRQTAETSIRLEVNLDGSGICELKTGVGFLDHMLCLFAAHGRFDLRGTCQGDTWVDDHHTVEDLGICLGRAFACALGDKRGICRYGSTILPMDEVLVLTAADLSGRSVLVWDLPIPSEKVGTFDTELAQEFWLAFVREAGCSLHVRLLAGGNSHHILEGLFKSAARTLRQAVKLDPDLAGVLPSTKGVLE